MTSLLNASSHLDLHKGLDGKYYLKTTTLLTDPSEHFIIHYADLEF